MKLWKHFIFVGILIFFVFGCSGKNSLNGTWENRTATIIISGNNITIMEEVEGFLPSGSNLPLLRRSVLHELSLDWIGDDYTYSQIGTSDIWRGEIKGTFSILNDKIEIIYSEPRIISVFDISQTENTITIKGFDSYVTFNRKM